MTSPSPLTTQKDVIAWIEDKNRGTTTESQKIRYATNRIQAAVLTVMTGMSNVRIDTKTGPVYISRNAFKYLSEIEKQANITEKDLLILRTLTERKLFSLAETQSHIPTTPEEYLAFRTMLQCFHLDLPHNMKNSVSLNDISRSSEKASATIGSSTPEFITRILEHIQKKTVPHTHQPSEESMVSPAESHKQIEIFEENPRQEDIQSAVTAFRTLQNTADPIWLRKSIKKISHHLNDSPKTKCDIFKALLLEYEKQCQENPSCPGYTFHAFTEAVFDEFFGTKEQQDNKYTTLTELLTAFKYLPKNTSERSSFGLAPHLKEALSFYCALHPNQPLQEGSSPLAQTLRNIDASYHRDGEPPLWEKLYQCASIQ